MNLNRFQAERQDRWRRLDDLVRRAGNRPERLGADTVRAMAGLYRAAAADLAYARSRFPGEPIVDRLEDIVGRARLVIYERHSPRTSIVEFATATYWRLVWERRWFVGLSAALLVVPGLFGYTFGFTDPDAAATYLPEGFLWVREAETTDQGYGAVGLAGFSLFVMTNNIFVTLLTFVTGLLAGIGTTWILLQNGFILGAVAGLAIEADNGGLLVAAVAGHGVLELSCIVVGGGAGLSLGRAILRPGRLTRVDSTRREALRALQIFLGTAAWLVVAGFMEGFLSRTGVGPWPVAIVGLVTGVVFWGLVAWRGAQKRAVDLAAR